MLPLSPGPVGIADVERDMMRESLLMVRLRALTCKDSSSRSCISSIVIVEEAVVVVVL